LLPKDKIMRRWNGWGDDTIAYPLQPLALALLQQHIGDGARPQDIAFADVAAQVPSSRLTAHPSIITDVADRILHARGQSLPDLIALRSGSRLIFPDGAAYPTTLDEVRQLIRYAGDVGVRLIPYGGGTSVVGHVNILPSAVPTLTVDLSRMSNLIALDEVSDLAIFGAGITGANLEASLRARGYTLGHFPQSFEYSTLGGWIATRSKGQQSVYYGGIERLFAGGRMETSLGTLDLAPLPASAAGPDLREIVLGSEGRMGIITEAAMRVSRLPAHEDFRALFFADFGEAIAAVREMAQARLPFSMLRLLNGIETELTLSLGSHQRTREWLEWLLKQRGIGEGKSMLLMGVTGNPRAVRLTVKQMLDIARKHGGVHIVGQVLGNQWRKSRFRTPYLRNTLWEMGYAVDTVETAVDWAHVPATLQATQSALKHGLEAIDERVYVLTHLSHVYASGSSIYTTYIYRIAADPEETLRRWKILKDAASRAMLEHGATISHQHGVGVDHLPYLVSEKGESGLSAIRDLCRHFDPQGIMNPGKLFE
jgi:alkyldihydroxyacetonephosphate synthase